MGAVGMSPADIDEQFIPRIRDTVAWVELDGEVVVYDELTAATHLLNKAAATIWLCCDGSTSLNELIGELIEFFQADRATIGQDVIHLVRKLGGQGLLEGVTERNTNGPDQS
jgi:Coenzyme PQQ synthesis protein D (PqqD)